MLYDVGMGENQDWIVAEEVFNPEHTGKCESIMCLGNGYMGIRAATEEDYPMNHRYALVAGTFDQFGDKPTELPNFADLTGMAIYINGNKLDCTTGICTEYMRTLNLKNGLLRRSFVWEAPSGERVRFLFERFVSLADKHFLASKVSIQPLSQDVTLQLETGINGSNRYGLPHFAEINKECNRDILQYCESTKESHIPFVLTSTCRMYYNAQIIEPKQTLQLDDMYIAKRHTIPVKANDILTFEKFSNVYTARDHACEAMSVESICRYAQVQLEESSASSFVELHRASSKAWGKIWAEKDVVIQSKNPFDQLALRFAVYHLTIMAPIHDRRMNIGAKGLSGKGYLGHTFWDTELFMLPFFIFTDPEGARSLLEYRYHTLFGARQKAAENGYEGAMYPWESAWITDSETTPSTALMALQEHHITADVAYGVYNYYCATGDVDFMEKFGYEIFFETARFWQSRLDYNKELDRYEILGVIGPDEFTHDADNNAFTNYMAYFNMKKAIEYYEHMKTADVTLFEKLNDKLKLEELYRKLTAKINKLYLPRENENFLVPQDDTYLTLPEIDLTPYRSGLKKLRQDYKNLSYSKLQVSKQADVMVLFILLEDLFSEKVKRTNFYYYEPRCVHESSLSLCSYSILAADVHEQRQAYELYVSACRIDLGTKMDSSNDGIHAASLGGVWQCTVFGFLGVRVYHDQLRIQPNLPEEWSCMKAALYWKGNKLFIEADKEKVLIKALYKHKPVTLIFNNEEVTFLGEIILRMK